jgi:hypothetical protein
MSKVYFSSNRCLAADFASCLPKSERPTSIHPVNLFSRFHVLWPCLTRTNLIIIKHLCCPYFRNNPGFEKERVPRYGLIPVSIRDFKLIEKRLVILVNSPRFPSGPGLTWTLRIHRSGQYNMLPDEQIHPVCIDFTGFRYYISGWKWKAHWWGSRTSNPVCRANTLAGGFDSHALPPIGISGRQPFSADSPFLCHFLRLCEMYSILRRG